MIIGTVPELVLLAIAFIILAVGAYYAHGMERYDLSCGSGDKCFEGNGKYFIAGKYQEGDSFQAVLNKLEYLSRWTNRQVVWRKYFLAAAIVSVILLMTVLPLKGKEFIVTFLVIFMSLNLLDSFYNFHVYLYPIGYMKEHIEVLRKLIGHKITIPDNIQDSLGVITGTKVFDLHRKDYR